MIGTGFLTPKRVALLTEMYGAARGGAVARLLVDFQCPTEQKCPVLSAYYKHTKPLRQASIVWLTTKMQVPATALACDADGEGWPLAEAKVRLDDHGAFEFADDGDRVLVAVARDEGGEPIDLICWTPRSDRVAALTGSSWILGVHEVDHLLPGEDAHMHRGFCEWLRAGRRGLLLLDRRHAWRSLVGIGIVVQDISFGTELGKVLRPPMPKISVPETVCGASV